MSQAPVFVSVSVISIAQYALPAIYIVEAAENA